MTAILMIFVCVIHGTWFSHLGGKGSDPVGIAMMTPRGVMVRASQGSGGRRRQHQPAQEHGSFRHLLGRPWVGLHARHASKPKHIVPQLHDARTDFVYLVPSADFIRLEPGTVCPSIQG